jgi:hypothetical protein
MNDQERELDLMVAELEQENRLLRARNERLQQRTWVGLTDQEIDELHGSPMELEQSGELKWVRAIEAKLKEKNT